MADGLAHPAHLPVPAFTNCQQQHRIGAAAPRRHEHDGGRQRAVAVQGNALAQACDRVFVRRARDVRFIGAFDAVPGVSQARREVAIVGEQEQTFTVVVESSNRVDVLANAAQRDPSPCDAGADRIAW